MQPPVLEPDKTVRIREPAKLHAQCGRGRAGFQIAKNAPVNLLGRLKKESRLQADQLGHLLLSVAGTSSFARQEPIRLRAILYCPDLAQEPELIPTVPSLHNLATPDM